MLDSSKFGSSANLKRGLGFFLAFCFALGAFGSGLYIGKGVKVYEQTANIFSFFGHNNEAEAAQVGNRPNLEEFWKVWDLMEEKYVSSTTTEELTVEAKIQGAIEGLVDAYDDPYSLYMPPQDSETFNENISGNFGGVGMEVGMRDRMVTVIAPLAETPAEEAGIMAGDVIVKIDEVSTEGMGIDEAVKLIRGEKGTVVNLQIFRAGESDFIDVPITRDIINIPTAKFEQIDDVFIISLYSFNAVAESQMQKAIKEYLASDAKSLVIDVRGNPGGFLESAVNIASYFLPAGKIVVKEQFGDSRDEIFRSRSRQIQSFSPANLVVLVDGGSASASEILAGALQDHGVATVIGAKTFGKGSVQELVELESGSALKVTIARWLTPNGASISEGGLVPDIMISRTVADRQAEIDPQKDAAIRFLKGEKVESESLESNLESEMEE